MKMKIRSTLAAVLVASVATAGAATLQAAPASAAAPASGVRPAISCIWNPANNSNQPGTFTGSGVNIRTGPDTSCTAIGSGYPGHSLTVRCYTNAAGGYYWIYLTDNTTGKTGWSRGDYVTWSGGIAMC